MARPKIPRGVKPIEYKTTPSQRRSVNKYRKEKDQINLVTPSGWKDKIKSAAIISGMSISEYILEAVKLKMKTDNTYIDEEEE